MGALVTLLILQMRKWRPREVKQLVWGPTVGKRKPCVTDQLHSFIYSFIHPLIHSSNRHVMKFTVWNLPGGKDDGVAQSRTRLSDFTFTFHFHVLGKEMATHSSVLAWKISGMGEPGRLPSMGWHRVGHNWSDLAAAAARTMFLVTIQTRAIP